MSTVETKRFSAKNYVGELNYLQVYAREIEKGEMGLYDLEKNLNLDKVVVKKLLKKVNLKVYKDTDHYQFNESFFTKESADAWYFAGFFAADGTINKASREVRFHVKSDEHKHLHGMMTKFTNAKAKFSHNTASNPSFYGDNRKTYHRSLAYRWRNETITQSLIDTYKVVAPEGNVKTRTFDVNPKYERHFLRGFFDGDGCISITEGREANPSISFTGVTESLNSIKYILDRNGIKSSLYTGGSGKAGKLTVSSRHALRFRSFLYGNGGYAMDRKKDKFEKVIQHCTDYDATPSDMARLISVSHSTIANWIKKYDLPHTVDNYGRAKFTIEQLDDSLKILKDNNKVELAYSNTNELLDYILNN